jgi:hypothetical protein
MFRGSTIVADDMLYIYTEKGDMNLVKPDHDGLKVMSTFKINKGTKEHFAHPVIHKGVLYIRHGKTLMAYAIRKDT